MLICKGDKSYACSKLIPHKAKKNELLLSFTILEILPHNEVMHLFDDNTFYFYDDVLEGRLPDTDSTNVTLFSITSNADLTYKIKIKLTKGAVENES